MISTKEQINITQEKSNDIWTKKFVFLFVANFFFFLSYEMLLATIPIYISKLGGKGSIIGIIIGIFTISSIIIRPFSDSSPKKFGRKKILIIGTWICVISTGGYYVFSKLSIIFIVRILHGFGFGLVTTLLATLAADSIPKEQMGEGMGYFGLGSAVSMSIGSFIGIWILNAFNFFWLFSAAIIILLAAIIFMQMISESTQIKSTSNKKEKMEFKLSSFFEPLVLIASVLIMLLGFSYGGILGFIALFGKKVGINNVGLFFMGMAICELISRLFVGKIFDSKGPSVILIPGAVACLIGTVLLAKTTNTTQLMISSLFYGMGYGAIFPSVQAWCINLVPIEKRNLANATFYNAFDLGIGLGAIILGVVVQLTSYSSMFLYSSILFIIFLLVYLVHLFKNK
ncbi:MFS transporter [Sedimentibacter sp. zth1]|uniref:MFS transporter n=1 Tax=Sedimentibacter sp. zth1 TaxID=2816908 RepID=UPI001A9121A9|nr:MFS transporter [Sedimentibacter sp. zth1]QSX06253.1 MFS transporter [Sedimentibacter sp. zth1]